MSEEYYEGCRCPGCRMRLDDVSVETEHCPQCNGVLDPDVLWDRPTRSRHIELPMWVTAFGWPFLLILLGVGIMAASFYSSGETVVLVPVGFIATGMVWFVVKLFQFDQ